MVLNQAIFGSWMWCASSLNTASSSISRTIFAEIGPAVGGLADGLGAERCKEIVAQVIVLERRLAHVAEVDAVDVGQKQIAGVAHDANVVLNVQRELEIVPPVAALVAVVRQDRVIEEDPQAVEVGAQAVEDDDVGRDEEKIP